MSPITYQFRAVREGSKTRFFCRNVFLSVALSLLASAVCLRAQEPPAAAGASEGEKMERQMWADFKAKEWKVVESKIAKGFQSIHPDGPRDRAGEISLIEHLNLGEFTLSNFKSTVNGDNIVVTYMIAVQETIDQKRLPAKPTPRLSVWKKGTHGWQWICHANLNPIP
jgi:Domain of unknown function (DUF4440)